MTLLLWSTQPVRSTWEHASIASIATWLRIVILRSINRNRLAVKRIQPTKES